MATQGMITVLKNQMVVMKIIAGSNGQKSERVAQKIRKNWPLSIDEAYKIALKTGLGSKNCLVVLTADDCRYDGDDDLSELYRENFDQPSFNPRWRCGLVEHLEFVRIRT